LPKPRPERLRLTGRRPAVSLAPPGTPVLPQVVRSGYSGAGPRPGCRPARNRSGDGSPPPDPDERVELFVARSAADRANPTAGGVLLLKQTRRRPGGSHREEPPCNPCPRSSPPGR